MATQLTTQLVPLLAAKHLHPTSSWLQAFLSTQRPTTPLPALLSTATFRLLASDITTTLSIPPHAVLPPDIQDANIKSRRLPAENPVVVQVLDVEDIGRSRWSQVEELEALERGEGTRGREIIRVGVPEVEGSDAGPNATAARNSLPAAASASGSSGAARTSGGPHKALLQDAKGGAVYGFEMNAIEGIDVSMNIGAKLELRGCLVARGMVMLEPETVGWLGGKNDAVHAEWVKSRKNRLKAKVEQSEEENDDEDRLRD